MWFDSITNKHHKYLLVTHNHEYLELRVSACSFYEQSKAHAEEYVVCGKVSMIYVEESLASKEEIISTSLDPIRKTVKICNCKVDFFNHTRSIP